MGSKKKLSKNLLKKMCTAHSQLINARKIHLGEGDDSQILFEFFDQKIRELEVQITQNLKTWLSVD